MKHSNGRIASFFITLAVFLCFSTNVWPLCQQPKLSENLCADLSFYNVAEMWIFGLATQDIQGKIASEGTAVKTKSRDTDKQQGSCSIKKDKEENIDKIMSKISEKGASGFIINLFNLISSITSWILFSILCLIGI
jgi:hypothetical protein